MSNDNDFDDLYGPKYFGAADLHGQMPRYRIGKVDLVELREKDGSTKRKFVVYFEGVEKGLVLNKTNATKLAAAYGKDRSNWIGVGVELYAEMTGARQRRRAAAAVEAGSNRTGRLERRDLLLMMQPWRAEQTARPANFFEIRSYAPRKLANSGCRDGDA